jgi:hypothetical protein
MSSLGHTIIIGSELVHPCQSQPPCHFCGYNHLDVDCRIIFHSYHRDATAQGVVLCCKCGYLVEALDNMEW